MLAVGIHVLMIFFWLLTGEGLAVATEEEAGSSTWSSEPNLAGDPHGGAFPKVDRQRTLRNIPEESEESIGQSSSADSSDGLPRPRAAVRSSESLWDELYQEAKALNASNDPMLSELIALSRKFADGREDEGFWRKFVWSLQRWIIYRSWYDDLRGDSPNGDDSIELSYVPTLETFLRQLVAVQKTLDEYWVIRGESLNGVMLQHLKDAINDNIRSAVDQEERPGRRDNVAQVVSRTARVVSSLLSVAGKYHSELSQHQSAAAYSEQRLEQIRVFSEISDSLGELLKRARTAPNLQLAMKATGASAGSLDGEAPFNTVSPSGLMGLKHLHQVLLIFFDVNYVEKSESDERLAVEGMPMELERLEFSATHFEELFTYVEKLLKGNLSGLMPADETLLEEHFADESIEIHRLPGDRPAVLTSEIIRHSLFTGKDSKTITLSQLNDDLFNLLCSPLGESEDAFKLLHQLRKLGDAWVETKDDQNLVDAQGALEEFLGDDDSSVGEPAYDPFALDKLSDDDVSSVGALPLRTHSDSDLSISIMPVDTANMHRHVSAPILPTARGMEGKP